MAYDAFTLELVGKEFGLTVSSTRDLFTNVPPVPPPAAFEERCRRTEALAWNDAMRSHFLIAPVLEEIWVWGNDRIALHAGIDFDVDSARGLTGNCDFVIGLPPQFNSVNGPIFVISVARNNDIYGGIGRCAAQLVAARTFNVSKKTGIATVFGCVTDGSLWRFLRLDGPALTLGMSNRFLVPTDRLFGILLHCVGLNPVPA